MLLQRVITGLLGGTFLLYSLYVGSWLYFALILLLAIIGWSEYKKALARLELSIPLVLGAVLLGMELFALWLEFYTVAFTLLFIAPMICLMSSILSFPKRTIKDAFFMIGGFYYLACGFGSLLMLRHITLASAMERGFSVESIHVCFFAVFAFFCTWASDTFAYFAGKAMGKQKLCPQISPGKTVEGFIGGVAGTIITALIAAYLFNFPLLHGAGMGLLIAFVAPLGDLAESLLKRACGLKDSGAILPGHGGVLDRFDSILFVAPAIMAYLILLSR